MWDTRYLEERGGRGRGRGIRREMGTEEMVMEKERVKRKERGGEEEEKVEKVEKADWEGEKGQGEVERTGIKGNSPPKHVICRHAARHTGIDCIQLNSYQ